MYTSFQVSAISSVHARATVAKVQQNTSRGAPKTATTSNLTLFLGLALFQSYQHIQSHAV